MGDVDNDGLEDLYVTNFGSNRLYRNIGGRFEDMAAKAGVAVDSWTTGCAWGDYDSDGALDLFVAGYVALDRSNLPLRQHPAERNRAATHTPAAAGGVGMGASATRPACRLYLPWAARHVWPPRPARARQITYSATTVTARSRR